MAATAPAPAPAATAGADRAARRLAAWAQHHPQAAALARLASLAVRVDASLLRRLRLQLLPRAEPGIEADLWFAGLQAAQGGGSLVFDAAVQDLLRQQLCQASAAPGQLRPLQAAWDITRGLHAAWPEALRVEEAITFLALQGGAGADAAIAQALQPALAAMATGGNARALEVARWAQRAMPRLPGAARQHPAVLALWLGALVRLGATGGPLPAASADGLPPDLRWLLPAAAGTPAQRLACEPLADGLRLRVLPDGAPDAAQQITLPAATARLLAVTSHDTADQIRHQTALVQGETLVPLPPGWQQATLHNLAGQRWQLRRQAGHRTDPADEPLAWQRMRVVVLNASGPCGMGTFCSGTEVVTVSDVLPPAMVQAHRAGAGGEPGDIGGWVQLHAWDSGGQRHTLQARLVALDLRSSLALLALERPFAGGTMVLSLDAPAPAPGTAAWTVPGLHAGSGHWPGTVLAVDGPPELPPGRAAAEGADRHIGVQLPQDLALLAGIAGAPVFVGQSLVGIADGASVGGGRDAGSLLWAVPAATVDRFLAWARRPAADAPQVLLHHPAENPQDRSADLTAQAVQRIAAAAGRARLRLLLRASPRQVPNPQDDPDDPAFAPGLAAAVRLVTPATQATGKPGPGMGLLALAARRWARPDFGLLQLAAGRLDGPERLPAPMAALALHDIDALDPESLARHLLATADPADPLPAGPLPASTRAVLEPLLADAARPFAPAGSAVAALLAEAAAEVQRQDQDPDHRRSPFAMSDWVMRHLNRSSRLDAGPAMDLLAQLVLPLRDNGLLEALRQATAGAFVLNASPVQLARLLIARAHAGHAPPPCLVVRDPVWQGQRSGAGIAAQLIDHLAGALGCSQVQASVLLERLALSPWVLIPAFPLPTQEALDALRTRLPAVRFLFLHGQEPGPVDALAALGAQVLPPLPAGADMHWLQGYKRLMEWARPRSRPAATQGARRKTRAK